MVCLQVLWHALSKLVRYFLARVLQNLLAFRLRDKMSKDTAGGSQIQITRHFPMIMVFLIKIVNILLAERYMISQSKSIMTSIHQYITQTLQAMVQDSQFIPVHGQLSGKIWQILSSM